MKLPTDEDQSQPMLLLDFALHVPISILFPSLLPPIVLPCLDIAVESKVPSQTWGPPLFVLKCTYNEIKWSVVRTIMDLYAMHSSLSFNLLIKGKNAAVDNLPPFPKNLLPFSAMRMIPPNNRFSTIDILAPSVEKYMQTLALALRISPLASDFCRFLRISGLSFGNSLSSKPVEMAVSVKQLSAWGLMTIKDFGKRTKKIGSTWLVIGESWIGFLAKPFDFIPSFVILVDSSFRVRYKEALRPPIDLMTTEHHFSAVESSASSDEPNFDQIQTNRRLLNSHFSARTSSTGSIRIKPLLKKEFEILFNSFRRFSQESEYFLPQKFQSFAPEHQNCKVKFYVDGAEYFSAAQDAINNAKNRIYLAGWWIFPNVHLNRPMDDSNRLDKLLEKAAIRGVQVFVLVFKEFSAALPLMSDYTKKALMIHKNIKILRHPDTMVNLWAHHEKILIVDDFFAFVGGLDLALGRFDTPDHPLFVDTDILVGQDFSNPRFADFKDVDKSWNEDLIDRNLTPRMPWHDVSCSVFGNPDVSRHFVHRWNSIKTQKKPFSKNIPYLLPPEKCTMNSEGFNMTTQVVRSLSNWSGQVPTECSIFKAYCKLIEEAKDFVYIENQFFVTCSKPGSSMPYNCLGEVMVKRIISAHKNSLPFKIIVVMPLLPAFTGKIDGSESSTLRLVMNMQYESISRSSKSIFAKLVENNILPETYIQFYALRTFSKSKTEMVYVHSKIMIADDERAIIGSANINDRSLLGSRDSEVAVVLSDNKEAIRELRLKLMKEHSGTKNDSDLSSVNSPEFKNVWDTVAKKNTKIFRRVFRCVPDDKVETWEQYNEFLKKPPKNENLSEIKGHLVEFPAFFLRRENLGASFFAMENLVPPSVFS